MQDDINRQSDLASSSVQDSSTGELISQLSAELSDLVRNELRLAQAEVTGKAKKAGVGFGLVSAAGVLALYALAVLVAAAVFGLAVVVDGWLAALIVAAALFAIAAAAAAVGRKQVEQATPPLPSEAASQVKKDLRTLKKGTKR